MVSKTIVLSDEGGAEYLHYVLNDPATELTFARARTAVETFNPTFYCLIDTPLNSGRCFVVARADIVDLPTKFAGMECELVVQADMNVLLHLDCLWTSVSWHDLSVGTQPVVETLLEGAVLATGDSKAALVVKYTASKEAHLRASGARFGQSI